MIPYGFTFPFALLVLAGLLVLDTWTAWMTPRIRELVAAEGLRCPAMQSAVAKVRDRGCRKSPTLVTPPWTAWRGKR